MHLSVRSAAMADVIGVLTSSHISALQAIETALGGTFMGLAAAARTAKRARRLTPRTCRRLERLDLAMHVARHATTGRMAELLEEVAAELAGGAVDTGARQADPDSDEPDPVAAWATASESSVGTGGDDLPVHPKYARDTSERVAVVVPAVAPAIGGQDHSAPDLSGHAPGTQLPPQAATQESGENLGLDAYQLELKAAKEEIFRIKNSATLQFLQNDQVKEENLVLRDQVKEALRHKRYAIKLAAVANKALNAQVWNGTLTAEEQHIWVALAACIDQGA